MDNSVPLPLYLIPLIIGGFIAFFVLLWSFVCLLISLIGGWWRLARHYRATLTLPGKDHSGVWGMIGLASYKGTLNVRTSPQGLYLSVNPLFQIGHPPLFIPWSHIRANGTAQFKLFNLTHFEVGQPTITTLSLPGKVLEGRS